MWDAAAGGEPDCEDGEKAEEDCDDHGVEAAEAVGEVARGPAAEEAARVDDGEELVGEGCGDAVGEGVGGNVRERNEEAPFDKEDAGGRERECRVPEDPEVGPDVAAPFREQAGADQEVCEKQEDEEDERHAADGPLVADEGKELL